MHIKYRNKILLGRALYTTRNGKEVVRENNINNIYNIYKYNKYKYNKTN